MPAKFENAIEYKLLEYSHQSWSHKPRAETVLKCEHQRLAKGAQRSPGFLPEKAEGA